jgi:hypothetical protein
MHLHRQTLIRTAIGATLVMLLFVALPGAVAAKDELVGDFVVGPADVSLSGNYSRTQLVVTARGKSGVNEHSADLTHQAKYRSSDPRVVSVSPAGELLAEGNGNATVTVAVANLEHVVPVTVVGVESAAKIDFSEQVMPILSKAGCNAGACHASQYGKGGFKLSVFGFAPGSDYAALVREGFGRRINPADPARSLFLLKATSAVSHGGGQRLAPGSVDHRILQSWVAIGAPGPSVSARKVTDLHVEPRRRIGAEGFEQQLRVVAEYEDSTSRDVTAWAKFDSTEESVVEVTRTGGYRAIGVGQGAVMVRFEGQVEIATVVVPGKAVADLTGWEEQNFIDRLAAAKFREVGVTPSRLCDDATFLRRAYLDVTGTIPTVEQAKAFIDSEDRDKRRQLVDSLLGLTGDPAKDTHNDDYAAYWTLRWSDLFRSSSESLGEQGMWALHNWLKSSFRENKPMDRVVRELITARGTTTSSGPANFYVAFATPNARAEATAQLFLGIRLQCAQCHHHPFETLSQADYYSFAAFFARVSNKTSADYGKLGGPPVILVNAEGEVRNPRTGQVMPPTPLKGKPAAEAPDRRTALADWLTARDNRLFARNIVNRYVAHLLGRGLVEPVDDMRASNPPSNAELLDALADDFVRHDFDVKHLLLTIMTSRLYQLDSQPTTSNVADSRLYSHYLVKRLSAETLLDAIDSATGVPTKFAKVPLGTRAIELPDAVYENQLLKTFGKPKRVDVCTCERGSDPNLAQALHTLNSEAITAKIASPQGRIAGLVSAKKAPAEVVAELYLAALGRRPSAAEAKLCDELLAEAPDAATFYQDLLWSLINSRHFLCVR